jgi:hypothetical protein
MQHGCKISRPDFACGHAFEEEIAKPSLAA